MHFPLYIPLGPLRVHPHLVFETLAYFIGFRIYLALRARQGDVIPEDIRWWVITAAALGAAAGSKLLSILQEPSFVAAHWREPYLLFQGKTIVGGLIGGWIAVEFCKSRLRERHRTGDLFVLPLCIGMAVGRIGCLLTGPADHTFGAATSLPWGIDFGDGVRRHPLPAYEIIFLLLLAATLWRLARRPHVSGDLFKIFMCAYMGWRFVVVEFLKDRETILFQISAIQWACAGVLLFYAPDIWRWLRQPNNSTQAIERGITGD